MLQPLKDGRLAGHMYFLLHITVQSERLRGNDTKLKAFKKTLKDFVI